MTPVAWTLLQFGACSLLILVSGVRLSRYGDILAEKTGLGGTWTGVVLMAAVTSFPELITGASAVTVFNVPDIAGGNAIGSCMFNLLILAILDVRHPIPLSARVHQGHVLSAAFGILQLALVAVAILAGDRAPTVAWIGLHSVLFIAIYFLAMRTIFVFERQRMTQLAEELTGDIRYGDVTLRRALGLYAINAVVLIGAAAYLPGIGERFAEQTSLAQSFVGTLLVVATSLPEMVVSIAAARLGAFDMAVASLFGSNVFNMAVVGIDDVLYLRGPMLSDVSNAHLITLSSAMAMTAVAIVGLTFRAQRKRFRLSWDSLAMAVIYVAGIVLLRSVG